MACFVISGKRIRRALAIVFIFALCTGIAAKGISAAVSTGNRLLPIYCVKTDEKQVAITFDAAWGNSDTEEIISILSEYEATATFFIVGDWADRFPESVKAFHNAGHTIANHSNTHAAFSEISREDVMREINTCNEKLRAITGETPLLLRAPSGDYDNKTIEAAEKLGMYTIQWSVDSLDYKGASAENIRERVMRTADKGSIILFHNDVPNTPDALRVILRELSEAGYSFVSVEELIYRDNYTINHAGVQIKNPEPPQSSKQAVGLTGGLPTYFGE